MVEVKKKVTKKSAAKKVVTNPSEKRKYSLYGCRILLDGVTVLSVQGRKNAAEIYDKGDAVIDALVKEKNS